MNTTNYSPEFLRQRKFYTYLPLLVLPFITLMFWALVAKKAKGDDQQDPKHTGLMMSLPEAFFKDDKELNKLSYYQKADADSARLRELMKKDPYYQDTISLDKDGWPVSGIQGLDGPGKSRRKQTGLRKEKTYQDPHEARVHQKIGELNAVLAKASKPEFEMPEETAPQTEIAEIPATEMKRLEALMSGLQSEPQVGQQEDQEMKELNTMLEKILDIQHPDRLAEKIRQDSEQNQDQVYPVTLNQNEDPISLLASQTGTDSVNENPVAAIPFEQNGFFSLDEPVQASSQNAIQAVVAETQTLTTGSTVKLRLTNDIYVSGVLIPKESFIYGTASLNEERLIVQIESVRHENSIFPVKLSVYDLDGISGIYIPGAISRDVSKQSLSQNVQGLNIDTFQPSLGAQLADAGIQTAKRLAGKKARLIRVTVKAGYQVLLKDGNSNS